MAELTKPVRVLVVRCLRRDKVDAWLRVRLDEIREMFLLEMGAVVTVRRRRRRQLVESTAYQHQRLLQQQPARPEKMTRRETEMERLMCPTPTSAQVATPEFLMQSRLTTSDQA